MTSMLILGFLMGMRHALEADHLAAVASLSTQGGGWRAGILRGSAWGLGHTLTLLLVGGACLLLGMALPERIASTLEAGVGLMLIVLGIDVFRRMRRGRLHVHLHRHGEDLVHVHAHRHAPDEPHAASAHEHPHHAFPLRALLVGTVHGMAGSAALLILAVQANPSRWAGLAYIVLFGLGSIFGMAALSAALALPLRASTRLFTGASTALETVVGLATIGVGGWVFFESVWGGLL
jgi:hypothetical protein